MPRVDYRNLPEEIYEEIEEVWHDLKRETELEDIERIIDDAQTSWLIKASEIIAFRKSMQEYNSKIDKAFSGDLNVPINTSQFRLYISTRRLTDSYLKRGLIPV